MLIRNSLSPATIEILESARDAGEVIEKLCRRIGVSAGLDATRIEHAVLDRERTRTTAFPNGAALPHCRLPDLSKFVTGLAVLRKPVRWDSERHAVDRVMLITGPLSAVSDHLRILANGSQILDSAAIQTKLQRASEAHSAYELVAAAEQAIEARRTQVGVLTEVRREANGKQDYLLEVADQFAW